MAMTVATCIADRTVDSMHVYGWHVWLCVLLVEHCICCTTAWSQLAIAYYRCGQSVAPITKAHRGIDKGGGYGGQNTFVPDCSSMQVQQLG